MAEPMTKAHLLTIWHYWKHSRGPKANTIRKLLAEIERMAKLIVKIERENDDYENRLVEHQVQDRKYEDRIKELRLR